MGQKRASAWYDAAMTAAGVSPYCQGLYLKRNQIIAGMVIARKPKRILEFAAGCYQLAEMVLTKCASVELYDWSDFSEAYLRLCRPRLKLYPACTAHTLDIVADADKVDWPDYDAVVCVSTEHLEGDLEILGRLTRGCDAYLSAASIDDPGHVRYFTTAREACKHFRQAIDVKCCITIGDGTHKKYILHGVGR